MTRSLGDPSNAQALAQIKAAVRIGVRPSVFRHEWSPTDRAAVMALIEHEHQERTRIHGPCGQPVERSFNPEAEGWYEAYGVQCHACAALEKYESDHQNDDLRGVVTYVVDTTEWTDEAPRFGSWEMPHVADMLAARDDAPPD